MLIPSLLLGKARFRKENRNNREGYASDASSVLSVTRRLIIVRDHMKRLIPFVLGLFSLSQNASGMDTPESLVKSFQADYLSWNNHALKVDSAHASIKAMELAEESYKKLLSKYTLPGFKGEPIAYGSEPAHDPQKENIISSAINGDNAIVRTEFPKPYYSPIYEYHLVKAQGRWYLNQVYLVDDEGHYPGL